MNSFVKNYLPIILKSVLIVLAIVGVCDTAGFGGDFMSSAAFTFFTVQSNLWIAAICAVFLVFNILSVAKKKEIVIPNWLRLIKFVFTVAITLTFVVFSLMLSPSMIASGMASYLGTPSNICLHNLVPLIAIADWTLYDYPTKSNKCTFLLGAIMPLYYLVFALVGSVTGVDFGGGAKVPYFFLDYEANGWFDIGSCKFGVFYWIIILVVAVLAMGLGFIAIKNAMAKRMNGQAKAEITTKI